jgi:DNA-binding transcriptional MerR regulator
MILKSEKEKKALLAEFGEKIPLVKVQEFFEVYYGIPKRTFQYYQKEKLVPSSSLDWKTGYYSEKDFECSEVSVKIISEIKNSRWLKVENYKRLLDSYGQGRISNRLLIMEMLGELLSFIEHHPIVRTYPRGGSFIREYDADNDQALFEKFEDFIKQGKALEVIR